MTGAQAAVRAWVEQNPLRRWRKARGETLMGTAARLGVSMLTVQLWENGGMQPSEENLAKLAALLQNPKLSQAWDSWLSQRPK